MNLIKVKEERKDNMLGNNTTKSPRGRLLKTIWKKRLLYAFLLPAFVSYFIFSYIPMSGLMLAIKEYSFNKGILGSPIADPWFKYFRLFFNNINLQHLIFNTVKISALKLITGFPAPIILALMLNELRRVKFKRVVQSITYVPHFVSWVIVITILNQILTPNGGPINTFLESVIGLEPYYFMGERDSFIPILLLSNIWKSVGWGSIIYLAAISNINPELYEAAKIDGAGRLRMATSITLPCISNTIGIILIINVGGLIAAGYDPIYLMQQPGNIAVSDVLDTYVMNVGFLQGRYSLATVAGMFQGVIGLGLVVTTNTILRRKTDISLW